MVLSHPQPSYVLLLKLKLTDTKLSLIYSPACLKDGIKNLFSSLKFFLLASPNKYGYFVDRSKSYDARGVQKLLLLTMKNCLCAYSLLLNF